MKYWLISDTYFNHTKLEEWGGRSGDWQDRMKKGMMQIPSEDTLIHLGDVCIGNDAEVHTFFQSLKCKKILIRGNHDNKSVAWYLEHGWDFVNDGFWIEFMGRMILLSHRPMHPDMWCF